MHINHQANWTIGPRKNIQILRQFLCSLIAFQLMHSVVRFLLKKKRCCVVGPHLISPINADTQDAVHIKTWRNNIRKIKLALAQLLLCLRWRQAGKLQ